MVLQVFPCARCPSVLSFFLLCKKTTSMRTTRKYSPQSQYRLATAIVCSAVFLAFSFVYLYAMQGGLMRCLCCDWLGMTTYSPLWGALVVTLVLWGVQWLLEKVIRMGRIWQALSYFPAYWSLAFLTCVSPIESGDGFSLGWTGMWWLFPIALFLYVVAGFVCRFRKSVVDRRKKSLVEVLIPNLIILILFSWATGALGNCNEVLHSKLLVTQCISCDLFNV